MLTQACNDNAIIDVIITKFVDNETCIISLYMTVCKRES